MGLFYIQDRRNIITEMQRLKMRKIKKNELKRNVCLGIF